MFPHNLTCVPLAEVECDIRRIVVDFYSLDDVIVMFVTVWVPSSRLAFGSPLNERLEYLSLLHLSSTWSAGRTVSSAVPVRMASAFSRVSSGWAWMRAAMCSVSSAGFADEMEVATIDLISAMFFIMVLDEKV